MHADGENHWGLHHVQADGTFPVVVQIVEICEYTFGKGVTATAFRCVFLLRKLSDHRIDIYFTVPWRRVRLIFRGKHKARMEHSSPQTIRIELDNVHNEEGINKPHKHGQDMCVVFAH